MPKLIKTKKDTVGIRVPENVICQTIVAELGRPLISASLPMDIDVEYYTDPELMFEAFGKLVDIVIDGGIGSVLFSTVIDCTGGAPVLAREGAGEWEHLIDS